MGAPDENLSDSSDEIARLRQRVEELEQALEEKKSDYLRLTEEVERLRLFSEAEVESIAVHENGRFVDINDATFRMFGYTLEEIKGKSIFEFVSPETAERIKRSYTANSQEPYEMVCVKKDGTLFPVEVYPRTVIYNGKTVRIGAMRDISERKKTENLLKSAHSELKTIFENAFVGIAFFDKDRKVLRINKKFEEFSGYSRDELKGQDASIFYTSYEDYIKVGEEAAACFKNGRGYNAEKLIKRKDGSTFWCSMFGNPVDMDDLSKGYIWISQDVSEKVRAREERHRNTATLKSIFDNAPMGIALADITGKIVAANKWFRKSLGYEENELTGMSFVDFTHPDHREADISLFGELMGGDRDYFQMEKIYIRKDGGQIWGRLTASSICDESGRPVFGIGLVEDITEMKKAEEERSRLVIALEQAADAVMITNINGVIKYVNPSFEKLTGFTREETLGQTPRMLKSGLYDSAFYEEVWGCLSRGEVWNGRIINRRKDGALYEEEETISPVFDTNGIIRNYVAIKHDVTARSILDKAREFFVAVTSHELRTPVAQLYAVKMIFEKLASGTARPSDIDMGITVIDTVYANLERIVSSTTLLSDLQLSQTKSFFQPVSLRDLVQNCVENARHEIKRARRKLECAYDESGISEGGAIIYCSGEMVSRAINELVSNAIKYTPDNKKVSVEVETRDRHAIITVRDQGPGIPESLVKIVDEPFMSMENPLHHSTGRYKFKGGGMGLGLTLTRMIAERHEGSLEISCGEEGGVVKLRLPLDNRHEQ